MAAENEDFARLLEVARVEFSRWLESASLKRRANCPNRPMRMPVLGWLGIEMKAEALWCGKLIDKWLTIIRKHLKKAGWVPLVSDRDAETLRLQFERMMNHHVLAFEGHAERVANADGNISPLALQALKTRAKAAFQSECLGRIATSVEEFRVQTQRALGSTTAQDRPFVGIENHVSICVSNITAIQSVCQAESPQGSTMERDNLARPAVHVSETQQIANNLKRLRGDAGWSQRELASAVGCDPARVAEHESGKVRPRGRALNEYCAALSKKLGRIVEVAELRAPAKNPRQSAAKPQQ